MIFVVSPGVSVVAAGLVSGLCFIVINSLRRGRAAKEAKDEKTKQTLDDSRCACCLKPFVVGRGVGCGECGSRVCRKGCSRWDTPDNAWHCLFCHQRRLLQLWLRRNEKWFETFGGLSADHDDASHRFSTAKSEVFLAGADYAGVGPGVGLAAGGEEDAGDSVERVREFVERIVEGLVGDVDEIPIDRLYDHIAYDRFVANYKQPLAGALARLAIALQLSIGNKPAADTPTMAHAALRDLVERAVEEARKLPGLGNPDAGRSTEPGDVADQTYEDLLATAILNKVIEKYQNERVDDNSNTVGAKRTSPNQKYITSEIEVGLDEGVEEGSSSLEPLSQDEYGSDCSAPPSKYSINRQEPLSLTIEEHIEEVTTTYTSDEEERDEAAANGLNFNNAHRVPFPEFGMDIIDLSQESSEELLDETSTPTHVDLVTPVESWEENWLFQKKKMQAQSEPVSMLVPNPSEDLKPLIGDREADDTSDLSDCSAHSDEEIEDELLEVINNVIPKPRGSPEESRASGLAEGKERLEIETRSADNIRKIGHENLTTNTATHFQINEAGANGMTNGHNEQKTESPSSGRSDIKLGIEDMLVFHLRDKNISQSEQKTMRQDQSSEFIEAEKSSGNIVTWDETTGGSVIKSPEPASILKSRASVEITSRNGTQTIVVNRSSTSFTEKTNSDVTGPQVLESVCRSDQSKDQQAKRPSVIPRDNEVDKMPQDQHVDLGDDLCSKGCPRTPTSSPLEQKIGVPEIQTRTDLHSLDEKLVSIETRIDTKLGSLEEKLRSHVPDLEKKQDPNVTEVGNGVVEARFAFIESGNENHRTVITKEHRDDLQNEDGAQQESEYTEHYDTATQRHLDSLKRPAKGGKDDIKVVDIHDDDDIPPPIPSTPPPIARLRQCREAAELANLEVDQLEPAERKRVEVDLFLATPPRPGTIAEREHKKWENAAPIENNPYSEENIQKRLWQRQYSRKVSSESLSGVNTEIPKVDGTSIQVVLGAGQPDVKRYGRDYYINEAKKASGERARRSAMLNAGRPNSSLSQNSGSFEGDIEQQVSYGLERFEEASLRGSLHRRSFRGQNSSPHFVTNPLLHLQVGEDSKVSRVDELSDPCVSDSVTDEVRNSASSSDRGKDAPIKTVQHRIVDPSNAHNTECSSNEDSNVTVRNAVSTDAESKLIKTLSEIKNPKPSSSEEIPREQNDRMDFSEMSSEKLASISDLMSEGMNRELRVLDGRGRLVDIDTENFERLFKTGDAVENFAVNPLYDLENNFQLANHNPQCSNFVDRDSGMYSIESNEVTETDKSGISKDENEEPPKRLSVDESKRGNEIVTSNGKRYSNFGSFKFHTFGGIKRRRFNWNDLDDEFDETDSENEDMAEYPDNISNFGSMKCQTFGGIKQRTNFDVKNITKYRKVKLRPALSFRDAKEAKKRQETTSENGKDILYSNFETRRDPSYTKFRNAKANSNRERLKKKKPSHHVSSKRASAERNIGDENLMASFLRDALMRPKSRLSTDNESIYSLDTAAARKSSRYRGLSSRPIKPRSIRDDTSLRLEPPESPEVVEKSFETLAGLRRSRSLKDDRNSILRSSSVRRKISEDISMW
ncbi:uncharacterized protein LOC107220127 isoform X3 [Neodiprion lecontei]|uniref:Uncharacterized protein LOC107220127 isoform X3 n=1 Tax=Neodiprion lecontei TaxID=441921 RepID=A0ABM3FQC9_NEOLC|nr:uncharacterized protein LOC107220127 isoform X3 [Neodiprion lecontei]